MKRRSKGVNTGMPTSKSIGAGARRCKGQSNSDIKKVRSHLRGKVR